MWKSESIPGWLIMETEALSPDDIRKGSSIGPLVRLRIPKATTGSCPCQGYYTSSGTAAEEMFTALYICSLGTSTLVTT